MALTFDPFSLRSHFRNLQYHQLNEIKGKYVNAHSAKILHEKISNRQVKTVFILFLNARSGSATTTSSPVKPLGAVLYWKPVALTKNTTVVVNSALVATVSYQ